MFRSNPDVAARFLDRDVIDSLCSGRELTTDWPGSNLHVEAVMLSSLDERRDLGRARFTASYNTIGAILRWTRKNVVTSTRQSPLRRSLLSRLPLPTSTVPHRRGSVPGRLAATTASYAKSAPGSQRGLPTRVGRMSCPNW